MNSLLSRDENKVIAMNKKSNKGPGRPRKYDSDAERKKAYRERKKEELQKLESRAKRIEELKGRIDTMEKKLVKYVDHLITVDEPFKAYFSSIADVKISPQFIFHTTKKC